MIIIIIIIIYGSQIRQFLNLKMKSVPHSSDHILTQEKLLRGVFNSRQFLEH